MEMNVLMPRLGVNDDSIVLAEWLVGDGDKVSRHQKVAVIETSKETSEVVAETDGIISFSVKAGDEVPVGTQIAVISDRAVERAEESRNETEYKMTDKAKALIKQYNIDLSLFNKNKIIKEKDVWKHISEHASQSYEITETKENQFLIYGAGGCCKVIIDMMKQNHSGLYVYGIISNKYPELKEVMGIPVLGDDDVLDDLYQQGYRKIINSVEFINKVHCRKSHYEMLKDKGFSFVSVIHKSAVIEPSARIGEGNIICAGAVISTEARIGNNNYINTNAVISHDCKISDNCHIASGAVLAGNVTVGENTLIGQGVTIYMDVKIGKNVVIQNGCHVFKDVGDNEKVLLGGAHG